MDISNIQYFWWIVAGVFLFLEIITPTTIFIFPALSAVVIALISGLIPSSVVQIVLFLIVSFFSIYMIRPLFVLGKRNKGYKQGRDALIGQEVMVTEDIDNLKELGRIKHGADYFPARNLKEETILRGSWVKIINIEGITVFVEQINKK